MLYDKHMGTFLACLDDIFILTEEVEGFNFFIVQAFCHIKIEDFSYERD